MERKMTRNGVILGVLWGVISPIIYWLAVDYPLFIRDGISSLMLQILTLPLTIYSQLIPAFAPGGTFYYSPLIVLPVSVAIGAVIGYGIEKGYQKVKGKR